MTRVLVTGASGFLGRTLVSKLAKSGYSGVATGRQPPSNLPPGWQGVPRDDVLLFHRALGPIHAAIHLEVKHHVLRPDASEISEMQGVNVGGTRDWLNWASEHNITRFVLASSVKAAHSTTGRTLESATLEDVDAYGRTKAMAEQATHDWAVADPVRSAIILRVAPVYGPGTKANIASFARQVLRGRPCFVGRGTTLKSVVSLQNATAAFEWALRTDTAGCEVFNVVDPTTISVGELATLIASAAGAPRPRGLPKSVASLAAWAGDLYSFILRRPAPINSQRLRAVLETTDFPAEKLMEHGFVHPQTTKDGITELVTWLCDSSPFSIPD